MRTRPCHLPRLSGSATWHATGIGRARVALAGDVTLAPDGYRVARDDPDDRSERRAQAAGTEGRQAARVEILGRMRRQNRSARRSQRWRKRHGERMQR
jgi:hypothetical protein